MCLDFARIYATVSDTFCIAHVHYSNSGCGKREKANKFWSIVMPEKEAPVTGTALRATGPALADSWQGVPSVHYCVT